MATGQKYTDAGQAYVIDLIDPATRAGTGVATYYIAWGSSSTTPAVTDTGLGSENPEARTAATTTQQTTQSTGDTIQWAGTITATGTRTVQEVMANTASTAGTCLCRIVHGSLALESSDQVTYTIKKQQRDSSGS